MKLSLSHSILGQGWCLIVLIPDFCPLSYFMKKLKLMLTYTKLNSWIDDLCTEDVLD